MQRSSQGGVADDDDIDPDNPYVQRPVRSSTKEEVKDDSDDFEEITRQDCDSDGEPVGQA